MTQTVLPAALLASHAAGRPWHGRVRSSRLFDGGEGVEAFLALAADRSLRCRVATLERGAYAFVAAPSVPSSPAPGAWLRFDHLDDAWPRVDGTYAGVCAALGVARASGVSAFVHGAGAEVPPHVDSTGGLVLHVEGERRWRLAPPSRPGEGEFDPLKPRPWGRGFGCGALELTLGRGDWLFVPAGWWHATRSPAPSMIVRFSLGARAPEPADAVQRTPNVQPSVRASSGVRAPGRQ